MAVHPPAHRAAHRAGADESEDDLAASDINNVEANGASKKKTATKSKSTMARKDTGKTATKRKAPAKEKPRQALKDRTNLPADSDQDEPFDVDQDEVEEELEKPKKRAKTAATGKKSTARANSETSKPKAAARKPKTAKAPEDLSMIPETQQPVEEQEEDDIEQSIEEDPAEFDVTQVPTPKPAQKFVQRARSTSAQPQALQPRPSARATSLQPQQQQFPANRERSGSVSGTERERRGGDPELRRKLNDLTSKHENLNLKYQNLQELGKSQADNNFEKLKRASDEKAKNANELIASLKRELAEAKKPQPQPEKPKEDHSKELKELRAQVSKLETAQTALTTERDTLKSDLQVSQNENKSLEAKLVAARQQVSEATTNTTSNGKQTPGSAMKNSTRGAGTQAANSQQNNASTTETQKEAKMKENLYADLTGLIIRGVKRREGEDEYDCIQTGRNGTLHFHLSIAHPTPSTPGANNASQPPKTPGGLSYEEAEFAYEPLLDANRDEGLLALLPDYLTEEICFPRNHAGKFYGRVVDCLTKRVVVEEEE
ncbi:hypothetical protein MBLNU230_g4280t1 [Neophaeotheca triangularis]